MKGFAKGIHTCVRYPSPPVADQDDSPQGKQEVVFCFVADSLQE
jgi:hypothetical protein